MYKQLCSKADEIDDHELTIECIIHLIHMRDSQIAKEEVKFHPSPAKIAVFDLTRAALKREMRELRVLDANIVRSNNVEYLA